MVLAVEAVFAVTLVVEVISVVEATSVDEVTLEDEAISEEAEVAMALLPSVVEEAVQHHTEVAVAHHPDLASAAATATTVTETWNTATDLPPAQAAQEPDRHLDLVARSHKLLLHLHRRSGKATTALLRPTLEAPASHPVASQSLTTRLAARVLRLDRAHHPPTLPIVLIPQSPTCRSQLKVDRRQNRLLTARSLTSCRTRRRS